MKTLLNRFAIMKAGFAGLVVTGLLVSGAAQANLLVDTGQPNHGGGGSTLGDANDGYPYSQNLAAEFSLSAAYTITEIQGWIGGDDGTVTVAIYTDGGDLPGTQLFAQEFVADAVEDWDGASSLSWLLGAGTYWVSFEVRANQTLDGYMPNSSPAPLGNEAFTGVFTGNWNQGDSLDIGVRIYGSAVTVPEPSSLALLGLGMAGLLLRRRRT